MSSLFDSFFQNHLLSVGCVFGMNMSSTLVMYLSENFYRFIPSLHELEEIVQVLHSFCKYSTRGISFSSPNSLSTSDIQLSSLFWQMTWPMLRECKSCAQIHRDGTFQLHSPCSKAVHHLVSPGWVRCSFVHYSFSFGHCGFHLFPYFRLSLMFDLVQKRHSPPESCEEDGLFLGTIAFLCLLLLARNCIFKKF